MNDDKTNTPAMVPMMSAHAINSSITSLVDYNIGYKRHSKLVWI
jgi:hypothetical protein